MESADPGVVVPMPRYPWELTVNLVEDALLNCKKLPLNTPTLVPAFVVVAKSMRRPVPEKVPVAWVRVRREV